MSAVTLLKLLQPLSMLALVAVLMFRRVAWLQQLRVPVTIAAFAFSTASLLSHIL